jgi:hypothetical protein
MPILMPICLFCNTPLSLLFSVTETLNSLHVISKGDIRNSLLKFKCAHPYTISFSFVLKRFHATPFAPTFSNNSPDNFPSLACLSSRRGIRDGPFGPTPDAFQAILQQVVLLSVCFGRPDSDLFAVGCPNTNSIPFVLI